MRYTLRLLTAQQFQRAAALVCACEVRRAATTRRALGRDAVPDRAVGRRRVSPNWYDDADEQIADGARGGQGPAGNVLQTLSCPWCGSELAGHRDLRTRRRWPRRVFLFCPTARARTLPVLARTRAGEGLPVVTVDEEIYRLPRRW